MPARILPRLLLLALLLVVALLAAGAMTVRMLVLASLPRSSGSLTVDGLGSSVRIDRDDRAIPVVHADSLTDASLALGYLHAQDRFFQMDLLRRNAAGRLAELIGEPMLGADITMRTYRFEHVASQLLDRLPNHHREHLDAYTRGVNAGLADLGARPPEYFLLRTAPEPWKPTDTILVLYSMFHDLAFGAIFERQHAVLHAALPAELVAFLTPERSRYDAPILPDISPQPWPRIPGPEVIDLRSTPPESAEQLSGAPQEPDRSIRGSNNWAVSGSRTHHGHAILAGDMHLGLSVPNIWYRAQLQWGGRTAAGVTLPGVPGLIAGSTDSIAWSFTNVTGDFQDLVLIEVDPDDPTRYRTPDGYESFGTHHESIGVRGKAAHSLELRTTRWGVVSDTDFAGRPRVLKWTALDPGTVNLRLFDILEARTIEDALDIFKNFYGPPQNIMIAGSDGRIAWTFSGYIPVRRGFDGTTPVSWAEPGVGWDGTLPDEDRLSVVNPRRGHLASANARMLPLNRSRDLGRNWALGARQKRINDRLDMLQVVSESDMLDIQRDTRVELLDPYRQIILATIPENEPDATLLAARRAAGAWRGTADGDEVGIALLHSFRNAMHGAILGPIAAPCNDVDSSFHYWWFQAEETVLRLLEERPMHFLPSRYESWDGLIRETLGWAANSRARVLKRDVSEALLVPWEDINRVLIHHPISLAVPRLGRWLDMPRDGLPGHPHAVRVQSQYFGASQRLVVSPNRLDLGILHMPAGQSGHPFSPHYRDGHSDWTTASSSPLLAGPPTSSLTLTPPAPRPAN